MWAAGLFILRAILPDISPPVFFFLPRILKPRGDFFFAVLLAALFSPADLGLLFPFCGGTRRFLVFISAPIPPLVSSPPLGL